MQLKRFKVDKLIRDHLPDIMRSKGIIVCERVMDEEEFIAKLKDKMFEEAKEVQLAKDKNELTEELADLLEVIYALCKAEGLCFQEIEKARIAKQKSKGSFDKKIYNAYVDIEATNPSIEYYLQKQDSYPQIFEISSLND